MGETASRLPAFFISHGGGPWHVMDDPLMGRPAFGSLIRQLEELGELARRRATALLVVSAHWEEPLPTVHVGAAPGMFYDYYGFPPHTYTLSYPAPGAPELSLRAASLLERAGFKTGREEERGYDHGLFVPLMVALPEASLPIAQLSLVRGLDPATHYAIGEALAPLRDEGVLIIGSGYSYHNLRGFLDPRSLPASERFDAWLRAACEQPDPQARKRFLLDWEKAPDARACHPRSEHLVPVFVAAGAAGADPGRRVWSDRLLGVAASAYAFGE